MQTVRVVGNTVACSANDVATKNARFGLFVGNVDSLDIEGNRVTLIAAGITSVPPADAIRVVGYLGGKAVIRDNYVTGFAMGVRVVPLTGNGPGTRAEVDVGDYLAPIRPGSLWLVADNAIEGASTTPQVGPFWPTKPTAAGAAAPAVHDYIDAPQCLQVNNVYL